MKGPKRQEKVMSAEEAAKFIKDGSMLCIGGFTVFNKPMVMVYTLLRRRIRDLFLVTSAPAGMDADMLVGAGCVKKLASSSVSLERIASIGPRYRHALQRGELSMWECCQGTMVAALQAGAKGLPYMPSRTGLGTDLPKVNPGFKLIKDPFKGQTLLAVEALRPDVFIVHCREADPYGNGRHGGIVAFDRLAAAAADKIIVVTEKVVSPEVIKADSARTTISCLGVVAVVEAPYGCHPGAAHGCYPFDEAMLREYAEAARSDESFKSYLDKYVYGVKDHEGYLERIGLKRLVGLTKHQTGEETT